MMNDEKIIKFENKDRIKELNPIITLVRAGFKEGQVLCDIGAGTGVFSFPASKISIENIYALEVSDRMIEILEKRVEEREVENLIVKKVDSNVLPLENDSCDMAIMVTVLHEIKDKEIILNEVRRILRKNGRFMVIEFYNKRTPVGPPAGHRISEEELVEVCNSHGFKIAEQFSFGANLYGVVFE
jgi:ubiquinone/menaquinone biosynthesis C-methylase UbiE